jgi:hypothetical protein
MKKRNGFVSNSSSSSFVFIGVKTEDNDLIERAEKIAGIKIMSDDSVSYIGQSLADWGDEEGLECQTVDVDTIKAAILPGLRQLGFTIADIKLHFGTRAC